MLLNSKNVLFVIPPIVIIILSVPFLFFLFSLPLEYFGYGIHIALIGFTSASNDTKMLEVWETTSGTQKTSWMAGLFVPYGWYPV